MEEFDVKKQAFCNNLRNYEKASICKCYQSKLHFPIKLKELIYISISVQFRLDFF